jgi:hypothetical protein
LLDRRRECLQPSGSSLRDEEGNIKDIRFNFRYITYQYKDGTNTFLPITYDYHDTYNNIIKRGEGIKEDDHPGLVHQYGLSTMDIVIKEWYIILMEDVINLYYLFQFFIIIIWFMNSYFRSGIILSKSSLKFS